ncbi:MAG: hypothetical protein ACI970_001304, partial [Myxococcota bacterium]
MRRRPASARLTWNLARSIRDPAKHLELAVPVSFDVLHAIVKAY